VSVGIALGAPVAWITSRAALTVIGGTRVSVAASLFLAAILLIVTAVAATAAPALHASAVGPLDALHYD
jgi:hypothetical protein